MDMSNWQMELTAMMATESLGNPTRRMTEGASQLEKVCLEEAG